MLKQTIDQSSHHFSKELNGQLTKPGLTSLRNIVFEFVHNEFKQRKEELLLDRIMAFKNNDWASYS